MATVNEVMAPGGLYRNTGAPWTRADGTHIARGAVFRPTREEWHRRWYKLKVVSGDEVRGPVIPLPENEPAPVQQVAGVEEWPGWPLRMSPRTYVALHPQGQHGDLGRRLIAARDASPVEEELKHGPSADD